MPHVVVGVGSGLAAVFPFVCLTRWCTTAGMSLCCRTLLVYGGFSHRCEDFCDDMWSFNVSKCVEGTASHACQWREVAVLGRTGPGKYVT